MLRIPFENISKIYYKHKFGMTYMPDINLYLNGFEKNNFGGTCYSNNYYLYLLLSYLGSDAKLCGVESLLFKKTQIIS
jgi:arylamine N-acetyltransferase